VSELRAKDVTGTLGMMELRCPETAGGSVCNRLLIRFQQAGGESLVETFCSHCGTRAEWRLHSGRRPMYKVTERRV